MHAASNSPREADNLARATQPPAQAGPRQLGPTPLAAVVAVGIGLLLGSIWASRGQNVFGGAIYLPGGRAVAAVLLLLWAYVLARRAVPGRTLLPAAGAAACGHIICLLFARFWAAPQDLAALGFASCVLDGILITAVLPCLLGATLHLDRLRARLSIALGFLLATAYSLVFTNLGEAVAFWQWVLADLAVVALSVPCMRLVQPQAPTSIPAAAPAPAASGTSRPQQTARPVEQPTTTQAGSLVPWAIATALAALLMLVQGIVAQATGYGATGAGARFGTAGDIISLTTRLLVVLYCAFSAVGPHPVRSAATLALVWCVALVTSALEWGSGSPHIGELLLEGGYNILQTLILIWAYEAAAANRDQSAWLFCIASAAVCANQLTRIVGLFAIDTAVDATGALVVARTAALCLGILAAAGFVALLVASTRRPAIIASEPRAAGAASTSEGEGGPQSHERVHADGKTSLETVPSPTRAPTHEESAPSPFARQEADFCRRFELACDARALTQREREVLFEAVHGYTIDNIAERLCISRETVKSNLARAYARAGVNGKQAFLAFMDEQRLEP